MANKAKDIDNLFNNPLGSSTQDEIRQELNKAAEQTPKAGSGKNGLGGLSGEEKLRAAQQRAQMSPQIQGTGPKGTVPVTKAGEAAATGGQKAVQFAENFKLGDEVARLEKLGADELAKAYKAVQAGILDTPAAKAIAKVVNTPGGRAALRGSKVLSRIGLKALGPIGWAATVYEGFQLGKAIYDNIQANKDFDEQAYLEAQERQMRRANGGVDPEVQRLEKRLAETNEQVAQEEKATANAKQAMEAAQAQHDQLVEQAGGAGVPPTGDSATATSVPQPGQPMNTAEVQPTMQDVQTTMPPTVLDYTDLNNVGDYSLPVGTSNMTGGAASFDPVEEQVKQNIMNSLDPQQNAQTQTDILNQLNSIAQQQLQIAGNDPRYQGGVVQPENPYNVNENDLRRAQRFGEYYTAFANPGQLGQVTADNARQMYQQQMANQLGVPYEDYIAATTEQRTQQIAALGQQRENILKAQAAQATNLKDQLTFYSDIQKMREETNRAIQQEILKGRYDIQKQGLANKGSLDVAQTNVAGDIATARINEPARLFGSYGQFAAGMGYLPTEARAAFMVNAPNLIQEQMRAQGIDINQAMNMFRGGAPAPQQRPTFGGFNFNWNNQ
ncbi:MAG: hypothetical protein NC218_08245 [Acetobacter sp.]|nr:hypothetical protein [Acetobacter sp.]